VSDEGSLRWKGPPYKRRGDKALRKASAVSASSTGDHMPVLDSADSQSRRPHRGVFTSYSPRLDQQDTTTRTSVGPQPNGERRVAALIASLREISTMDLDPASTNRTGMLPHDRMSLAQLLVRIKACQPANPSFR
jgi:hypothetical protein